MKEISDENFKKITDIIYKRYTDVLPITKNDIRISKVSSNSTMHQITFMCYEGHFLAIYENNEGLKEQILFYKQEELVYL